MMALFHYDDVFRKGGLCWEMPTKHYASSIERQTFDIAEKFVIWPEMKRFSHGWGLSIFAIEAAQYAAFVVSIIFTLFVGKRPYVKCYRIYIISVFIDAQIPRHLLKALSPVKHRDHTKVVLISFLLSAVAPGDGDELLWILIFINKLF